MKHPFQRGDSADANLPEPYGPLLAFLSDLHEQIALQIDTGPAEIAPPLHWLRQQVEVAGLVVIEMAR